MADVKQDFVDVPRIIVACKAYANSLKLSAAKQKIPLAKQAIEKEAADYEKIVAGLQSLK